MNKLQDRLLPHIASYLTAPGVMKQPVQVIISDISGIINEEFRKETKVRDSIKEFAEEMEKLMQKHDAKKGDSYMTMPLHDLENGLLREVEEWHYAENCYDAMKELLDVANYCMMLYHRYTKELEVK